ncbi:helix-turn-helix transcriptional regulator [Halalkalibacterium halodurans]|uniref:helix-turn-helix domain-containing protein n=1 Tax=Halalkalibacterium halodurans TaxID=86665 RepID=UPI002E1AB92E|nr:helix-turn-helix transcriptional regulator [Halalkalibacterium halodurans]
MKINHRIKEIRVTTKDKHTGKKLSGIAIAKKLGITPQYYYEIERGEKNLSADMAAKLADIFGVTTDYLLGKTDDTGTENNPDLHEESELSEIPIEKLNQYKLVYKGHELSEDEAEDIIQLLEAALKRWKK